MNKPDYHFFVCNSFRLSGEAQGVCHKKEAAPLLQYLEEEILDRGIDGMVSSTGCLKLCDKGPVMIVYPAGWWYGDVDEDKVDEILDALEAGKSVAEYLI